MTQTSRQDALAQDEKLQEQQQQQQNDLHVVTENGEQCFMWVSNQLTYIGQDRCELPKVLANRFGPLATKLDLSYNSLTSFENINSFINLSELILDNNQFRDQDLKFTQNLRLRTLSLNKNKLVDLYKLIQSIKFNFPNLEYLSLIGNPLCPLTCSTAQQQECEQSDDCTREQNAQNHQPSIYELILRADLNTNRRALDPFDSIEVSYRKYRHFIIYHLPKLRFLDSASISSSERDEALRRCLWMGRRGKDKPCSIEHTSQQRADTGQTPEFRLSIVTDEQPCRELSELSPSCGQNVLKGTFSKLAYKYTGKNSEGNRFIRNHDL